jgi:hypothetical protein
MRLLFGSFGRGKREIQEELEARLRTATKEFTERGMKAEEARASAIRELGNAPLVEGIAAEMWGGCGWIGCCKLA